MCIATTVSRALQSETEWSRDAGPILVVRWIRERLSDRTQLVVSENDSLSEDAHAFLELLLVDLPTRKTLLENIERRLARRGARR